MYNIIDIIIIIIVMFAIITSLYACTIHLSLICCIGVVSFVGLYSVLYMYIIMYKFICSLLLLSFLSNLYSGLYT